MPFKDPIKKRAYVKAYSAVWREEHREKVREYQRRAKRKARLLHPEREKATKRRSYLKHRQRNLQKMRDDHKKRMSDPTKRLEFRAQQRAWAMANPEKHRASIKNWHKNNLDRVRTYARKHSALRRHRVGNYTHEQWVARFRFYGERCAYCLKELTLKSTTIDHIIPIIVGGTNWASNLAPACRTCNVRKNRNRLLPLWLRKAQNI